jgi:hypothetical protein
LVIRWVDVETAVEGNQRLTLTEQRTIIHALEDLLAAWLEESPRIVDGVSEGECLAAVRDRYPVSPVDTRGDEEQQIRVMDGLYPMTIAEIEQYLQSAYPCARAPTCRATQGTDWPGCVVWLRAIEESVGLACPSVRLLRRRRLDPNADTGGLPLEVPAVRNQTQKERLYIRP